MTTEQRAKICKRMLWIIPGLILAIIGDYCMGVEPKGSTSCGTLIHNYNVIYEAAQGDTARAVAAWNRSYAVQAFPYWVSFVVLGIASTGGWIVMFLGGIRAIRNDEGEIDR